MEKNYASLAFTAAVKKMQEKMGSRTAYARLENNTYVDGLTENEVAFISQRDSFYMATISENGFPYIQHRGGPKGFLKVLDATRLGIVDFKGNSQYISVGNLATHDTVSMILVDYPAKARLKILSRARIVALTDDDELFHLLNLKDYKFKPERMMVFTIEAYDWNCSQHITPRYTLEDIAEGFASQRDYIEKLEAELKSLRAAINDEQ